MAYQFECTQCGKKIAVPDKTQGRQAKCPFCSALMMIPAPSSNPSVPVVEAQVADEAPAMRASPASDTVGSSSKSEPIATAAMAGPLRKQSRTTSPDGRIGLCGKLLTTYGVIGLVAVIWQAIIFTSDAGQATLEAEVNRSASNFNLPPEHIRELMNAMLVVFAVLWTIAGCLTVVGGIQMVRQRTWWLALLGGISALVPFYCCLPLIGWPIAAWAIVLLAKNRAEFQ